MVFFYHKGLLRGVQRILLLLMAIPLCAILHINNTYTHRHTLPDGSVVEHAHPFRAEGDASASRSGHTHSDDELLLYTLISGSPVISVVCYVAPELFTQPYHTATVPFTERLTFNDFLSSGSPRAPPSLPVSFC